MEKEREQELAVILYLNEKYHESFVVEELSWQNRGNCGYCRRAVCHSEANAQFRFSVFHFMIEDVVALQEILNTDALTHSRETGWYADDYSNILFQKQYESIAKSALQTNLQARFVLFSKLILEQYFMNDADRALPVLQFLAKEVAEKHLKIYLLIEDVAKEQQLLMLDAIRTFAQSHSGVTIYMHVGFVPAFDAEEITDAFHHNADEADNFFMQDEAEISRYTAVFFDEGEFVCNQS